MYLQNVLNKYAPRNLSNYSVQIARLKSDLQIWAKGCYIEILDSGSRAKGTAISIASDLDLMVSLTSNCNENHGGLSNIYNSLFSTLRSSYNNVHRQNVSIRIQLPDPTLLHPTLEVDVTPARKWTGNTNDHSLWLSKQLTWKKTNINVHIKDVSQSRRTDEIKLLKIWRELNKLDFPSIFLEYLLIKVVLRNKPYSCNRNPQTLSENFWHVLNQLSLPIKNNPMFLELADPANMSNILSDLLTKDEKYKIILTAQRSVAINDWSKILW